MVELISLFVRVSTHAAGPENRFQFSSADEGLPLEGVMIALAVLAPIIFAIAWLLSRHSKSDH